MILSELNRQKPDELAVVGIAVASDADAVKQYLKKYNIQYPVLVDRTGDVADTYQVRYVPMNFIIDKDGVILEAYGGATLETDEILELLAQLKNSR